MRSQLRKVWELRAPRERRFVTALAVALSVAMYSSLITSVDRARTQLRSSIPFLRAQANEFEQQASEYERLKVLPLTFSGAGEMRILIQTQADTAGLSHALSNTDAIDPDRVQVVFSAVSFTDWVSWISAMQLQRVRLVSGRIEALSVPGMVNVTATFIRSTTE